jgi:hypothetical protein
MGGSAKAGTTDGALEGTVLFVCGVLDVGSHRGGGYEGFGVHGPRKGEEPDIFSHGNKKRFYTATYRAYDSKREQGGGGGYEGVPRTFVVGDQSG